MTTYMVHETFDSLQGEGVHAGETAHFIRLQGCDVGCSWCLGPNTRIYLANGATRKITDIVPGDVLAGYDEATGTLQETVVTATTTHEAKELWTVRGEDNNRNVVCTPEHPWLTTQGWKRTDCLVPGDEILTSADLSFTQWRMRRQNPMNDPAVAAQVSVSQSVVWTAEKRDEQRRRQQAIASHRERMLGDLNPMKDPAVRRRQIATAKRNGNYGTSKMERRVARLIGELGLPLVHCAMDVEIGGRYPDFVSPDGKKVVEVYHPTFFGRERRGYAEERKRHYADHGVSCLPLSVGYGVTDADLSRQLTTFVLNGWKVASASPQGVKASYYRGQHMTVYDLTCDPYPTFFANGLLTHNCDAKTTWWSDPNARKMAAQELLMQIPGFAPDFVDLRPSWVIITGGEPLLYDLDDLLHTLYPLRPRVQTLVETSGVHPYRGFLRPDYTCVSPKYTQDFRVSKNVLWDAKELKYVVDPHFASTIPQRHLQLIAKMREDYARELGEAPDIFRGVPLPTVSLMPEGSPPRPEMIEWTLEILQEHPSWRFSPRLQYAYPQIAALEGDTNEIRDADAVKKQIKEEARGRIRSGS